MVNCSVGGCERSTRTKRADLCSMHYHRQYRHGTTDRVSTRQYPAAQPSYTSTYKPGHPLANKHGNVRLHRFVLFESIGAGTHPCSWCGQPVTWGSQDADQLQVDHINRDKRDNRLDNLVPSCRSCNTRRASEEDMAKRRAEGWWNNHDTVARLAKTGQLLEAAHQIAALEAAVRDFDPQHPLLTQGGMPSPTQQARPPA